MAHQIDRTWSTRWVGIGADHAFWFPQHDVDQSFTANGFAVDQDAVLGGIHKNGQGPDCDAIDLNRAFFDKGLARAA